MKRLLVVFTLLAALYVFPLISFAQRDTATKQFVPEARFYGTGSWNSDSLGNHRAVIKVFQKSDAVFAHIPWRRKDVNPGMKKIIVVDGATNEQIKNIYAARIGREYGDIVFQPKTVPGEYYVYYLVYRFKGSKNYPKGYYLPAEQTADPSWLGKNGLNSGMKPENMPAAELVQFQSIDEFNSFYPMEVIATIDEIDTLLKNSNDLLFLLFPEDRSNPIRMTNDLPYKWIKDGPGGEISGTADRGEFFAFQVGLYAAKDSISDIEISFEDLSDTGKNTKIPAARVRCFNKSGIDWTGKQFNKTISIGKGKVQPFWFGADIPRDIPAGNYSGKLTVTPKGMRGETLKIALQVTDKISEDAGDGEPAKHSHLRWLDSKIAFDDGIVPPFTPMLVKGNTVSCLGREVTLNDAGFPRSIKSYFSHEVTELLSKGRELLASPVKLIIEDKGGHVLRWKATRVKFEKKGEGAVAWYSAGKAESFTFDCNAQMEFDGYIDYSVTITASKDFSVNDIRLEIPYLKIAARYMMGMGEKGGLRPASFDWKWDVKKNQDAAWIGDVNIGMQCGFRDENYSRPLNTNFYQLKPLNMPPSWFNGGKGGFSLREDGKNTILVKSYSGERSVKAGEQLHFYFSLLVTPFKPIDTKAQWTTRYYHSFKPVSEIMETGANTINVHHATDINPYINYPFLRPREMREYIDEAHQKGMKVKIYYTVRELSNRAPELFALRSMGHEVLSYGEGGGSSWCLEHLDQDYIGGWCVPELKDAAIVTSGVSRLHNYYVEGLNWVVKNVGIDGLYIDDVAFDRTTMKRVRKILDRNRNGALIDLHSANQFNPNDGFANSANLYMEHFPYLNRLWFGEYFDYNAPPDFWLIEMSGIPYGLMGEMLQDGGNPWRGMIFGMTSRLPWAGDPRPLWKAMDEFGIADSKMIGYWSGRSPVKTNNKDVLVTSYVKKGKTLISIASWAAEKAKVELQIDWKSLEINPEKAVLYAPQIKDFQEETKFGVREAIPVEPAKGWLIVISEKP